MIALVAIVKVQVNIHLVALLHCIYAVEDLCELPFWNPIWAVGGIAVFRRISDAVET